jgi:hypothetical protein
MSRMSVAEAKEYVAEMEQLLSDMGGHDRSGYLPFQISEYKEAITRFEAEEKTNGKN